MRLQAIEDEVTALVSGMVDFQSDFQVQVDAVLKCHSGEQQRGRLRPRIPVLMLMILLLPRMLIMARATLNKGRLRLRILGQ
eukprot:11051791-Prorocentrum_lima.AAC.1